MTEPVAPTTESIDQSAAAVPELRFGAVARTSASGQAVLFATREQYVSVISGAKAAGFEQCIDITAVDYLLAPERDLPATISPERFELVVNLRSLVARERLRVRVQVPADDARVPSLYSVHAGSEAMEREAYDLLGISFDGHPDLTRILMPDDWEGHPLRKDYAMGRIPVQFSSDFRPDSAAATS